MSNASAQLRFGWRRSWLPPHLRRRLLAGLLAGVGVLFAVSSLTRPVPDVRPAPEPAAAATGVGTLPAGLVAAPVRLADPDVGPLLHSGIRVDVLAADALGDGSTPQAGPATTVARDVAVLSVGGSGPSGAAAGTAGGTLVLLAVSPAEAQALAGAEANGKLSVTLRSG